MRGRRGRLGVAVARYQPVRAEPDDGQQHHADDHAEAGRTTALAYLDRAGRLEHIGRPDRPGRAVLRVVLPDQRDRVGADDAGDAADVPASVEVTAAGGEVVLLDVPDDRFPDPGLVADLGDAETGLTTGFRQGFTDAHAASTCPWASSTRQHRGNGATLRAAGGSSLPCPRA